MARRRIESWFSLAVLLLVVALAILAQGLREDPEAHAHSVTSTSEDGRRGFFLLLQELGFAPIEWRKAPGDLPRGEHLLWLPERPRPWQPRSETEGATPDEPNRLPSHGLENYRGFVEEGGTLVAPLGDEMLDFLVDDFGLAGAESLEFLHVGEREERVVRLETGEQLALSLDIASVLKPFPAGSPWRELWILEKKPGESGAENLVAVEFPFGAGRVVLLSEDGFLDNSELGKAQHALAGVRLVEQLARGGGIYFDEYCLGLWEPQSALSLSASPRVFLLSVHALALLLLFVWAQAFARAFPRDPPPRTATSPLERAEALARIWKQSGRSGPAVRALRAAAGAKSARKASAAELEALARELEGPSARRR